MAGYEVVERIRDGQAPVEALVVEVTLTGLRELSHDAEVALLVRCQVPGGPEKSHDIGFVCGVERDDSAHDRHAASHH
ncbi:hypothetical protein WKI65_22285 [Streptomyces sp. MS1.AVA.3]